MTGSRRARGGRGSASSPRRRAPTRRPGRPRAAGSARRRARGAGAAGRRSAAPGATSRPASGARRWRAGCGRGCSPSARRRPGRYSVEPNASSAMNSCGLERSNSALHLLGPGRLVHLPALREQRQAEHPRDRGLAHLGRAGEDEEVVRLEDADGAAPGRRGHEHARELARRGDVERRAPQARRGRAARRRARGSTAASSAARGAAGSRRAARPPRRRRSPGSGRLANVTTDLNFEGGDSTGSCAIPLAADQHGWRERPAVEVNLVLAHDLTAPIGGAFPPRRVHTRVSLEHQLAEPFELQPPELFETRHA